MTSARQAPSGTLSLDADTIAERFRKWAWSGKKNGELLNLAEDAFDVLITIDTNLRYQQNLTGRKIAILLLLPVESARDSQRPFLGVRRRTRDGQTRGFY